LLNERGRDFLYRTINEQNVIRRTGRRARAKRATYRGDTRHREMRAVLFLDGGHYRAQFDEQRSRITHRRTDQQHLVARHDLRFLEQAASNQRRIDCAAIAHRNGAIDIGHRTAFDRNEIFPRHARHDGDHARIVHVAGAQLAFDHGGPHR